MALPPNGEGRAKLFQLSDTNIYIGKRADAHLRNDPSWAVVNTAKTVHCEALGWGSQPPKAHPSYLAYEDGQFLSFNWVDGPAHLYKWSGPQSFRRALDFIDRWYDTRHVLINCDQGQSRSPTVALLYLAKRLHRLPNESFAVAREAFMTIFPSYAPSGIADFVSEHWDEIV